MLISLDMINIDMSAPSSKKFEMGRVKPQQYKSREVKKEQSKSPWGKRIFLLIILSFFLTNIVLLIENKERYMGALDYIRSIGKKVVIYDTYTISFDDTVSDSFKNLMKENLGNIMLDKKHRFEFKDRRADFVVSTQKGDGKEAIFSKDLIPVGHMYSLLTELNLETLKQKNVYILDADIKDYIKEEYGIEATLIESKDKLVG